MSGEPHKPVMHPGIHGGHFYYTDDGELRYGQKPLPKPAKVPEEQSEKQPATVQQPESETATQAESFDVSNKQITTPVWNKKLYRDPINQMNDSEDIWNDALDPNSDQESSDRTKRKISDRISDIILMRKHSAGSQQLMAYTDDFMKHNSQVAQWAKLSGYDLDSNTSKVKFATSALIKQWAVTSGDHSHAPVAVQFAANKLFNLRDSDMWFDQEFLDFAEENYQKYGDALNTFLGAMYENTQNYFHNPKFGEPVSHVLLYRGLSFDTEEEAEKMRLGSWEPNAYQTAIQTQPISSWATSPLEAMNFAFSGHGQESLGMVMMAQVPAERILSTAVTGFGCKEETEMTVLGGIDDAYIYPFRQKQFSGKMSDFANRMRSDFARLMQIDDKYRQKALRHVSPIKADNDIRNADWTKYSWDLPRTDTSDLKLLLAFSKVSPDQLMKLPVFRNAVRRGLIIFEDGKPHWFSGADRNVNKASGYTQILHPGIRGGHFYYNRLGKLRYGDQPAGHVMAPTVDVESEKRGKSEPSDIDFYRADIKRLADYGIDTVHFIDVPQSMDYFEDRMRIVSAALAGMRTLYSIKSKIPQKVHVRLAVGEITAGKFAHALYHPTHKTIQLGNDQAKFNSFYHEYGHALDHAVGGSRLDSQEYGHDNPKAWASSRFGLFGDLIYGISNSPAHKEMIRSAFDSILQRSIRSYESSQSLQQLPRDRLAELLTPQVQKYVDDYYSAPWEMMARFFATYVEREADEKGLNFPEEFRVDKSQFHTEDYSDLQYMRLKDMFESSLSRAGLSKSIILTLLKSVGDT